MLMLSMFKYYSVQTATVLGGLPAAWALVPADIKAGMDPTVVGLIYWVIVAASVAYARKVPQ